MFKMKIHFTNTLPCPLHFIVVSHILLRRLRYGGKVRKVESRKRPRHTCRRI